MLLDSLAPGTVRWGRALERVSGPAEGPRRLHFADGSVVETDLVVGADGAFSRVRPVLSPATPQYSGVSLQEAWFDDVDNRHPEIAELVGLADAVTIDDAIHVYERAMLPRSTGTARILEGGAEHLLTTEMPESS